MTNYRYYNIERFRSIRKIKIQIHSNKIRRGYLIILTLIIALLFALPYGELIKATEENYYAIITECLIFNFATLIVLILYYLVVSKVLPKYHVEDEDKRLKFFSDNQVRLIIIISFLIGVMILIYAGVYQFYKPDIHKQTTNKFTIEVQNDSNGEIYFNDTILLIPKHLSENMSSNKSSIYTTYIVNQFILSVFLFFTIGIFSLTFHSLKSRLERRTKKEINKSEIYIYWYNFLKSLILENPLILLSAVLFTTLTISSFILRGKGDISDRHFIYSVAFYSFWFASLTAIVAPFFIKIRILNNTYFKFTSHRLGNAILPSIYDHIVVIGIGTLGSQLIENCFFDIHPEGYCVETICPNKDKHINKVVDDISDYDLIINKELELQLISRRIIIIEKNDYRFSSAYSISEDKTIGIFNIADNHNLNIGLLCIKGDARKNSILAFARCENSQVIVNTTPDSNLSLQLSSSFPKQKLILSVNSATAFEFLTSTTYDRAVYTLDTQQVEGIVISQIIFCWGFTNISNNIYTLKNKSINAVDLRDKILKKLNLKESENYLVSDLKKAIVRGGNDKILIAANGSYVFYIIQSLWMTLKFTLGMTNTEINELLEKKVMILTSDNKIKEEVKNRTWNFYPIRDRNTKVNVKYFEKLKIESTESQLKILTFINDITNFDSYLDIFKEFKIGLIVLMNDNTLDAVKMFTEAANSSEIISNSSNNRIKPPHIVVYSLASDKFFLDSLFKKYFAFNAKRTEKIGFPTQLTKESQISKDYISSNQLASMLRSIYVNRYLEEQIDDPIAELIFSVIQKPGALAYLVCKLCGLQLIFNQFKNKVPDFIYYYSTEMNIYRDTFIFKGTAKIGEIDSKSDFDDVIRYCFVNCEERYRTKIDEIILKNLELIGSTWSEERLINREFDSGMFSHYPISSILKHAEIHYDIYSSRKRLYVSTQKLIPSMFLDKKVQDLSSTDLLMLFNIANFCVWSEGEETPGSYAGLMATLMLGNIMDNEQIPYDSEYIPEILFSNNRPSFELQGFQDLMGTIAQDSFYIKLVKKCKSNSNISKNIRAIKLNLASRFIEENLEWSNYLFDLKDHLMTLNGNYVFFVIEKIFLEGTYLEGVEGISEISFYKKVNSKCDIGNPVNEFKVLRRKNLTSNTSISNMPYDYDFKIDDEWTLYRDSQILPQSYEIILIREDIVENAKVEAIEGSIEHKFQNMIFVIDDL